MTRQDWNGQPAEGFVSVQRVTLDAALAAYTRDAAYAEFEETRKGTLERGKAADLIVLSQDLFAVKPLEIRKTGPVLTMVGGKIVYEDSSAKLSARGR